MHFPDDIIDAMNTCALRFDGYKYEQVSGLSEPGSTGAGLSRLIEPIVKTLMLHADDNMNFAAFFRLQRLLYHWGDGEPAVYSDEHIAYDFLFLHLYHREVPDRFGHEDYCVRWRREFEGRKEEIARFVRTSFRRKGRANGISIQDAGPCASTGTAMGKIAGSQMGKYKEELVKRYWAYQQRFFPQIEDCFERPFVPDGRPPVFLQDQAWRNVIAKPGATQVEMDRLSNLQTKRHKWFGSMNSSQALAQSVLGNLAIHDHLSCLAELSSDAGEPLLGKAQTAPENFAMEHEIDHLGEPRRTSLDGFLSGAYQVAIECKFTEAEVGACSRPLLTPSDSNYDTDLCDGTFTRQRGRMERCSLTEIGVLYWRYVPTLFDWPSDADQAPCPLRRNYQLVRNVLAVCVRPDGTVSPESGHVVLVYDERNPAFQASGNGLLAFVETRQALKNSGLLRKCSWQRIIGQLKKKAVLPWLTEQLELKYGLG